MIFTELIHTFKKQLFYRNFFPTGDLLVFDVGAHIGKKTKLFLKSGCRVVAIEPQEICFPELNKLGNKFPKLSIEPFALSNRKGPAELFIGTHSETSTLSIEFKSFYEQLGTASYSKTQAVQTKTLTYLVEKYGSPFFLKIDAEGYESIILEDLKVPVPIIEFEYLRPLSNNSVMCLNQLSKLGNYEFNFCRNEEPAFYFEKWESINSITQKIQNLPETILHGNIYARLL